MDLMINPFAVDAFNMVSMTQAINILPNNYGRVGQLNLFADEGVTTRTVIVEEYAGVLSLLPTLPPGAPGTHAKRGKRTVRSFTIPHIPHDDVILPAEFQGIRAFGMTNVEESLASIMNRHLQEMLNKHAITLENLRMGAVKGIILDADASILYNLYAEFGIQQKIVNFDLDVASPSTDVAAKCREVVRWIEDHLLGEIMTDVRCLVSQEFFDALIAHPNVEKFYVNWQAAAQIANADPRKGFNFGGITFEEYRGVASDESGASRRFIAAGEGHAFPTGTMSTFKTHYAPADFMETVGTMGLPVYAKQELRDFARGIDVHTQSNPLPLCRRPNLLVKVTLT